MGPMPYLVEKIIAEMPNPPEIIRAGSKAFYSPMTDRVTLPPRELFISAEKEACTAAHELSHSAGHEKRLAREWITELAPFGSHVYSREELVAELSAAYLCAEAGISERGQSAHDWSLLLACFQRPCRT
jgi:antirestriction protein ArdC